MRFLAFSGCHCSKAKRIIFMNLRWKPTLRGCLYVSVKNSPGSSSFHHVLKRLHTFWSSAVKPTRSPFPVFTSSHLGIRLLPTSLPVALARSHIRRGVPDVVLVATLAAVGDLLGVALAAALVGP